MLILSLVVALAACEREERTFRTPLPNATPQQAGERQSANQPAQPRTDLVRNAASPRSPYEGNAYGVAQGKRLYRWYNCGGCHANGGGGMGPALMDEHWRYGGEPAQIFQSIVQGRPNGMPSFGGHIPEDQVWQIVAYVRSMGGQLRKDVAPSRSDTMYPGEAENARPKMPIKPEILPPEQPTGGPQQ
ncbi:c-type cytochrome [Ramlibacter algicola]|uniref:c-type cytochrome n=1 Tax=Ramlibacter algicola TaxID=2795217 RepID=UPI001EF0924A|nr:c-type cytochrome [Ramlibacter algicola]